MRRDWREGSPRASLRDLEQKIKLLECRHESRFPVAADSCQRQTLFVAEAKTVGLGAVCRGIRDSSKSCPVPCRRGGLRVYGAIALHVESRPTGRIDCSVCHCACPHIFRRRVRTPCGVSLSCPGPSIPLARFATGRGSADLEIAGRDVRADGSGERGSCNPLRAPCLALCNLNNFVGPQKTNILLESSSSHRSALSVG